MQHQLAESKHGTGYVHSSFGRKFRPHNDKLRFAAPFQAFDWNVGYDIEKDLGVSLPVKNQGVSLSCGGQAAATLELVNELFLTKTFRERSAKDIYSHIWVSGGGTTSNRIIWHMTTKGIAEEALVPSYENGQPPSEQFMEDVSYDTQAIETNALSAVDTQGISIGLTIDKIAQAVQDYGGVILAIAGENNGTWLSPFPTPPQTPEWGHFVYVGKAKMINGKKYIGILNSWGDIGDKGWQWLGEDYQPFFKDCFAIIDTSTLSPKINQVKWQAILMFVPRFVFYLERLILGISGSISAIFSKRI